MSTASFSLVDELESALTVDADRYVANFFAPAAARSGLGALYAFDNEVTRIGLMVREPMVGHIRLAWWREQIGAIYAGEDVHAPVSKALALAVNRWKLPRTFLDAYVDARARDLDEAPFANEGAFEAWAGQAHGRILGLAARVLCAEDRADAAIRHAGIAIAYRSALAQFQAALALGRYRLPVSWLESAGLPVGDAFAEDGRLPVIAVRARGRIRQSLINANRERFPLKAMPALAVAALARFPIDPYRPRALSPWQRASRLTFANLVWHV